MWILAYPKSERERSRLRESQQAGLWSRRSCDGRCESGNVSVATQTRLEGYGDRTAEKKEGKAQPGHAGPARGANDVCHAVEIIGDQGRPQHEGIRRKGNTMQPSWWAAEPALGRVAYGLANRVDRIEAIGDGQVPLVAAVAWRILTEVL